MSDKRSEGSKDNEKAANEGFKYLIYALEEASKISFSLVIFPIVFLLAGVWLDKKLTTTPIFIILGIILGITIAIYQVLKVRKKDFTFPEIAGKKGHKNQKSK